MAVLGPQLYGAWRLTASFQGTTGGAALGSSVGVCFRAPWLVNILVGCLPRVGSFNLFWYFGWAVFGCLGGVRRWADHSSLFGVGFVGWRAAGLGFCGYYGFFSCLLSVPIFKTAAARVGDGAPADSCLVWP